MTTQHLSAQENQYLKRSPMLCNPRVNNQASGTTSASFPNFVLFGRGRSNKDHPPNQRFNKLVSRNVQVYAEASKAEKNMIVEGILEQLHRFCSGFRKYDKKTGEYLAVSHETARQKVMHAIQHIMRLARKKSNMSFNSTSKNVSSNCQTKRRDENSSHTSNPEDSESMVPVQSDTSGPPPQEYILDSIVPFESRSQASSSDLVGLVGLLEKHLQYAGAKQQEAASSRPPPQVNNEDVTPVHLIAPCTVESHNATLYHPHCQPPHPVLFSFDEDLGAGSSSSPEPSHRVFFPVDGTAQIADDDTSPCPETIEVAPTPLSAVLEQSTLWFDPIEHAMLDAYCNALRDTSEIQSPSNDSCWRVENDVSMKVCSNFHGQNYPLPLAHEPLRSGITPGAP